MSVERKAEMFPVVSKSQKVIAKDGKYYQFSNDLYNALSKKLDYDSLGLKKIITEKFKELENNGVFDNFHEFLGFFYDKEPIVTAMESILVENGFVKQDSSDNNKISFTKGIFALYFSRNKLLSDSEKIKELITMSSNVDIQLVPTDVSVFITSEKKAELIDIYLSDMSKDDGDLTLEEAIEYNRDIANLMIHQDKSENIIGNIVDKSRIKVIAEKKYPEDENKRKEIIEELTRIEPVRNDNNLRRLINQLDDAALIFLGLPTGIKIDLLNGRITLEQIRTLLKKSNDLSQDEKDNYNGSSFTGNEISFSFLKNHAKLNIRSNNNNFSIKIEEQNYTNNPIKQLTIVKNGRDYCYNFDKLSIILTGPKKEKIEIKVIEPIELLKFYIVFKEDIDKTDDIMVLIYLFLFKKGLIDSLTDLFILNYEKLKNINYRELLTENIDINNIDIDNLAKNISKSFNYEKLDIEYILNEGTNEATVESILYYLYKLGILEYIYYHE
jgi:hypothetical protein